MEIIYLSAANVRLEFIDVLLPDMLDSSKQKYKVNILIKRIDRNSKNY